MTPFDVTYTDEFLLQEEYACTPQHQMAPFVSNLWRADAATADAAIGTRFTLRDAAAAAALRANLRFAAPPPHSLQPSSYTEYLLEMFDKDSVVTGMVFIAAYVGLLHYL